MRLRPRAGDAQRDLLSRARPLGSATTGFLAPPSHIGKVAARVPPGDGLAANIIASNRLIAAHAAQRSLANQPAHIAALRQSAQVYSHSGHDLLLQKPLHRCVSSSPVYQMCLDDHERDKVRLAALLRQRQRSEAAQRSAILDEYVDQLKAHQSQDPFVAPAPPAPQMPIFTFALHRPPVGVEALPAQMGMFESDAPTQMNAREAAHSVYEDRTRLVKDPVAALQVCYSTCTVLVGTCQVLTRVCCLASF